jgi:hypothetical protein
MCLILESLLEANAAMLSRCSNTELAIGYILFFLIIFFKFIFLIIINIKYTCILTNPVNSEINNYISF